MRGLVTSVSGSQPKGRGFKSRLNSSNFSFKQTNYFIKLYHLRHVVTFNSHYSSPFNHFHSTCDVTFNKSVVGCLKFPREVMWL
ncbi:MAG: hypothetical protein PV344_03370 [Anaplasma sp.]|nr:hypothetical protein [Anaplasma sp.]